MNYYYLVAPTVIVRSNKALYTYQSPEKLGLGTIVRFEIGHKKVKGVVFKRVTEPSFKTKPILEVLETKPLPKDLIKLGSWLSEYYATHLATVLQTLLPSGLGKKRRNAYKQPVYPVRKRTKIVFNKEQSDALKTIESTPPGTILLRGVTGSGKTRIYIETTKKVIAKNQSAIILVPEIALTSQLTAEFQHDFGKSLIVTHSTMTEAERHLAWRRCLEASEPLVIVGPRSALFSPVPNLGLIVIDECHEPSYKQEQSPRYLALRAASVRAKLTGAKVILGSATPSIIDSYIAEQTKRPIVLLTKPARAQTAKSDVNLVSFANRGEFGRHRFLSRTLLGSIEDNLKNGTQTLIFHNRRGSAPMTICEQCGWMAACDNCQLPLTLHTDQHKLICHVCGRRHSVPPNCPVCGQPDIIHKGIGTKLIVSELEKMFSGTRIARFDTDTKSTERLHHQYQDLYDGKIPIIVGTQMVAKGLDLPHLRTVGIIQADGGLNLPDFQSEERVFQLIHQVVGRVGRDKHASQVIVQTYQPDHPSIKFGISQDYEGFYKYDIVRRHSNRFPPFSYLLKLTCVYGTEQGAVKASKQLAENLREKFKQIEVLGPAPAFYERLGGTYRWQLIIKASSRDILLRIASEIPASKWQVDIDPANLL
jgi:primosomal protein N' (replication factor Y)